MIRTKDSRRKSLPLDTSRRVGSRGKRVSRLVGKVIPVRSGLRALAGGLLVVACTSPSTEELVEGKACTSEHHRCVAGYTCNEDLNVCVREGSGTTGGASGTGGSGALPAGGEAGVGVTPPTGGEAGSGGMSTGGSATGSAPPTGGEAGSGAVPTGGSAGTGGAPPTGGEAGSGAAPTGGVAGTGGAPTGGTGGTGGGFSCGGPMEDCLVLFGALRHRYSFEAGPGAVDSVGTADGTLQQGATLTGDGAVDLSGTAFPPGGGYVDLPNGIVSELGDATFEVWVDWDGVGGSWQRIFDFGDAMSVMGTSCVAGGPPAPEGSTGVCGRTYLALYANTDGFQLRPPRVAFLTQPGTPTNDAVTLDSSTNLPANSPQHLAVVVNDSENRLSLYRNGAPDGSVPFTNSLSQINDINNWLGRSQFNDDPTFDGQILEFRIYGVALTDSQIATSFAEGTNPDFLE